MSSVVLGIGASHSTLMNTHWHEVADDPGALDFRAGLDKARAALEEVQPDAIVILGSNHFRGMFLDLMPALTIGVGEVLGAGEALTPKGALPVDQDLARGVVDGLVGQGFDPAFSLRLTVDHGVTHGLQHLVPELDVPIVPVVMNMFAPPLPPLARCADVGSVIGKVIADDGHDKRVAVIASGGLSHRLPWPKWYETLSDDDRFLVEAWLNGRTSWGEYEVRRREIIRAADPDISEDFDRWFLQRLEEGDLTELLAMGDAELEERAGNGAHELRAWAAMHRVVLEHDPTPTTTTLAYAPIPSWLTGMAVSLVTPHNKERS